MGSLNDYGRDDFYREPRGGGGWKWRLLRQTAVAAALFFLVAASVGAEGPLGRVSRYVAGPGLAAESSWVDFSGQGGNVTQVEAQPSQAEDPLAPGREQGQDQGGSGAADPAQADAAPQAEGDLAGEDAVPQFTAPASGVVVTELAVASTGFASRQGILIRGSEGQNVRAAAQGTVLSLSGEGGAYMAELSHPGGYTSIYQGLSSMEVAVGDQVSLGQTIGLTATGELTFSLLQEGTELDPLEYLFN